MKKRTRNRIALIVILLLVIIASATVYFVNYAMKSKPSSRDLPASYDYLFKRDYLKDWVTDLQSRGELRDTFIRSKEGDLNLHALYIKAAIPTDKTAVIVHGYTDNAIRMLMIGHLYSKELGYNVILPDLSGHGESDGEWIQMGWNYRHEVMQWIDVAKDLFGQNTQIVLHGISMGAATVMMTSGEDLPNNVKCVVADCGYTDVWSQFAYQLKEDFGLPAFPFIYTASFYTKLKLGWSFKEASAVKQVAKCEIPIFFIHGEADTYVPTYMARELFDAKVKGDKEIWTLPGVKHADAYWDHTEEYVNRVRLFVDRTIQ